MHKGDFMKFNCSKKTIQLLFFSALMSQSITNSYGCRGCCGGGKESEEELSSRYPYAPLKKKKGVLKKSKNSNDLETSSKRLDVVKLAGKKYDKIKPIVYSNARTTDYKPSPPSNFKRAEAIMGSDDRAPVHNTVDSPWRVHGHLEMIFPNGKRYIGSGTMVNHRHVVTAGHCLYDSSLGGWATSVKFSAALNVFYSPIPPANATHLVTVKGWEGKEDPRFDMGMLILDRDLGEETGWHGISTVADSFLETLKINVTGYPGDKEEEGREMWTMDGHIQSLTSEQFTYTLDTNHGQSGGGVWSEFSKPQGYYCVGIHTRGIENQHNTATRISNTKFDRLLSWMNIDWK